MPDYLRGFQGADLVREFTDAQNQSVERWPPPQLPMIPPNQEGALFAEFEGIYGQQAGPTGALPHLLDGQHLNLSGFYVFSQIVHGFLARCMNAYYENISC